MNPSFFLSLFLIVIILPIICYFYGHPLLWFLYIILLICLLPSLLLYADLALGGYKYVTSKKGKYNELKIHNTNFLKRHFGLIIIGQELYDKPVIFIVNHHEPGAFIDNLIMMTLKVRAKAITYNKTGLSKQLFENIEHISINRHVTNRLAYFLEKCKKELKEGTSLIIFPEGKYTEHKSTWRKLYKYQTGAFILACQTGIPIVPLIISGKMHHNGIYSRIPVEIKYCNEIDPKGYTPEELRDYVFDLVNKELIKF